MQPRLVRVRGQMQGVGLRPCVWQLARRMGPTGCGLNDAEGVPITAAGAGLDACGTGGGPRRRPRPGSTGSRARPPLPPKPPTSPSAPRASPAPRPASRPDAATRPACAAEIRTPGHRQSDAFTNGTHRGPRFTILAGLPYDRAQTTLALDALDEVRGNR